MCTQGARLMVSTGRSPTCSGGMRSRWSVRQGGECVHLEDGSSFQHFSHEGGHPPQLAVPSAHSGKDAVPDGDAGLVTWHKTAHLRHQHIHSNLQPCHHDVASKQRGYGSSEAVAVIGLINPNFCLHKHKCITKLSCPTCPCYISCLLWPQTDE